ncbi:MAG: Bug family tripartite tricarboxylate transporter substrate binding protein [Pseudolabrys sp.]
MISRRSFLASGAVTASFLATRAGWAQTNYPSRPIRLIVPYAAGGGTDFFARVVGPLMADKLGQPIIIENKPGAGTIVGADMVAKSPADGYTFLLGDNASFANNVSLYKKLSYDPQADFAPISLTGRFAIVLLTNTDLVKANSVADLVHEARSMPEAINYGSSGIGSPVHLAAELFMQIAKVKLTHVPYRGAAPAMQGLLGGEVGMLFVDYATARAQLSNPKLKALGVASPTPFGGLPGVPTVAATYPGFEAWAWQGFALPARTPAEIVARLHDAYVQIIGSAEVKQKLMDAGIDPLQSSPDEMKRYMASETKKWGDVIRAANIQMN